MRPLPPIQPKSQELEFRVHPDFYAEILDRAKFYGVNIYDKVALQAFVAKVCRFGSNPIIGAPPVAKVKQQFKKAPAILRP